MKTVTIPAHVFTDIHAGCNKFLVCIPYSTLVDGAGEVGLDGCHSTPQEVSKARAIMAGLGMAQKYVRFVMITVEEVEKFEGKLNEEAIATLAPAMENYHNG